MSKKGSLGSSLNAKTLRLVKGQVIMSQPCVMPHTSAYTNMCWVSSAYFFLRFRGGMSSQTSLSSPRPDWVLWWPLACLDCSIYPCKLCFPPDCDLPGDREWVPLTDACPAHGGLHSMRKCSGHVCGMKEGRDGSPGAGAGLPEELRHTAHESSKIIS